MSRYDKLIMHLWTSFVIVCLVFSIKVQTPSVYAQEHEATHLTSSDDGNVGSSFAEAEKAPEKKKMVTVGFSGFSRGFKDICKGLQADGRMELVARHIEFTLNQQTDCAPCKALLRSFGAACKVKLDKTKPVETAGAEDGEEADVSENPDVTPTAEAEATAPPAAKAVPRQREPSTLVIDAVSQWFIRMAEDKKRSSFAAQTIRELTELMRDPEDLSVGEHEYLDILSEYMLAPFRSVLAQSPELPIGVDGSHAVPTPPPSVDDLFE